MPLYTQQKCPGGGHGYGFDQAIRGGGLDPQRRRQAVHALMVKGIDHGGGQTGQPRQHAVRRDRHVMRGRIFGVTRDILRLAMIQPAGQFVQMLVQAAAQRDVQFLKPAADGEQRLARLDRRPQQRQSVASRVSSSSVPGRALWP